MTQRRPTKPVFIGDVQVGGDAPIVVQSMTATDTADVAATLRQVHELAGLGCEIVRIAVPDKEAAAALPPPPPPAGPTPGPPPPPPAARRRRAAAADAPAHGRRRALGVRHPRGA